MTLTAQTRWPMPPSPRPPRRRRRHRDHRRCTVLRLVAHRRTSGPCRRTSSPRSPRRSPNLCRTSAIRPQARDASSFAQSTVPACVFGDPTATHTMVLYGDSHAGHVVPRPSTTSPPARTGSSSSSPSRRVPPRRSPPGSGRCPGSRRIGRPVTNGTTCPQPDQRDRPRPSGRLPGAQLRPQRGLLLPRQWQSGLEQLFKKVSAPKAVKLVLGNIPSSGARTAWPSIPTTSRRARALRLPLVQRGRETGGGMAVAPATSTSRRGSAPRPAVRSSETMTSTWATLHVAVGYSRFLETVLTRSLPIDSTAPGGAGT